MRGRVLPIGGLREKIIAAHRHQIKMVIIPRENEKDIKEIPARILKAVELVPVDHMDEVLEVGHVGGRLGEPVQDAGAAAGHGGAGLRAGGRANAAAAGALKKKGKKVKGKSGW